MRYSNARLSVRPIWLKGPVGKIESTNHLLVQVTSQVSPARLPEGLSLEFYATMPSMGHPMEDAGFFEEIEVGLYLNKSIRYNMPGDWRNELWLMDSDFKVIDRVTWDEFF
ncbi:MAG: hypothetical protein AAF202_04605 [Pseudomonadota bacterium]